MNFVNITHLNPLFASPSLSFRLELRPWRFYHTSKSTCQEGWSAYQRKWINKWSAASRGCMLSHRREGTPQHLVSVLTLPAKCFRKHLFYNTSANSSPVPQRKRVSWFDVGNVFSCLEGWNYQRHYSLSSGDHRGVSAV